MSRTIIPLRIESFDHRELWATLHLPQTVQGPLVLMAHGLLGFKDWSFFPWVSDFFADGGLPVLRFNFSGSGMGQKTEGPYTNLSAFERDTITQQVEDLHSVISCAVSGRLNPGLPRHPKVFLWGHSRGEGPVCWRHRGTLE